MEPINVKVLETILHSMMLNGVHYVFGAKAALDEPLREIRAIDCSGFVRYATYHATDGKVTLPDGSAKQHAYVADKLERLASYPAVGATPGDNRLFIAFIAPVPGPHGHDGHVWFVFQRETAESHGGTGPSSRPWNSRPLPQEVVACYVWPHVWQ